MDETKVTDIFNKMKIIYNLNKIAGDGIIGKDNALKVMQKQISDLQFDCQEKGLVDEFYKASMQMVGLLKNK